MSSENRLTEKPEYFLLLRSQVKSEKISEPLQKEARKVFPAEDFGLRDEITAAKLGYSLR